MTQRTTSVRSSHWWSADICPSRFNHRLAIQLVLATASDISVAFSAPALAAAVLAAALSGAAAGSATTFFGLVFSAGAFSALSFSAAALSAARLSLLRTLFLFAFFRHSLPLAKVLGNMVKYGEN